MHFDITAETIITAGAVLAAAGTIGAALTKLYKRSRKPDENAKQISALKAQHEEDIKHIKIENTLICFALSACLDGLMQLGCNHTVPVAKEKLDKHLNQQAHK